jgi:hypothetical protein
MGDIEREQNNRRKQFVLENEHAIKTISYCRFNFDGDEKQRSGQS